MKFQGVEFEKAELESLRGFLPGEPGAELLGKILIELESKGQEWIRDKAQGIEVLRYAQGWLDGLDRFWSITRALLGVQEEQMVGEDAEEDVEEVADVAL